MGKKANPYNFIRKINAGAEGYLRRERLYQYGKALEQARRLYSGYTGAHLLEATAAVLAGSLFSDNQQKLLRMFSEKALSQQELNGFLNGWDIEVAQTSEALLLSFVQREHPELDFGTYAGPRLRGILDYNRFRSLDLMFHYSGIIRAYNTEHIFPILNSGSLNLVYPELLGTTRKTELLLPDDVYDKTAEKIISKLGYSGNKTRKAFTVPIAGKTTNGVIRFCPLSSVSNEQRINKPAGTSCKAVKQRLFNADVLLLSAENRIFSLLIGIAHILRSDCNRQDLFFAVAELVYLIRQEREPDWDWLNKEMHCSEEAAEILLGVYFVNQLIPGLLPGEFENMGETASRVNRLIESDDKYFRRALGNPLARQCTVFKSRLAARFKR